MSLVGKVGSKRPRARLALLSIYALLSLGALTTLYPFVMMVGSGLAGAFDQNIPSVLPAYLTDDGALAGKYVDDKYAGNASIIASTRIGVTSNPALVARYRDFLAHLPTPFWSAGFKLAPNQVVSRLRTKYQAWLRMRYPNIGEINRVYLEENTAFQTVDPPSELLERPTWNPPNTLKFREWQEFKQSLPAEFRIPIRTHRLYQEWLRARCENQFSRVPPEIKGTGRRFEELVPRPGTILDEFRLRGLPTRYKTTGAEDLWAKVSAQPMPITADEAQFAFQNKGSLRREFAARNYAYVLDYVLLNGRSVWNTLLLCALAVSTQLIVNPLAAYALSRYPIRASGQILIFLLATMAFPAEVAMIPSFLLLKDLGLLNTFAALVLPGAASGYMIFLLKGFFDSLPSELFEAAQMDGAPETTMMARIALPLSRPVLGYLALLAFMGAYSTFIYAFLVCQDERLWTLMVWIYQLQNTAPKAVMMAALSLAALPTLAVFLLAQRTIMRGIVLPGER